LIDWYITDHGRLKLKMVKIWISNLLKIKK